VAREYGDRKSWVRALLAGLCPRWLGRRWDRRKARATPARRSSPRSPRRTSKGHDRALRPSGRLRDEPRGASSLDSRRRRPPRGP
jgi:hypothetical protein